MIPLWIFYLCSFISVTANCTKLEQYVGNFIMWHIWPPLEVSQDQREEIHTLVLWPWDDGREIISTILPRNFLEPSRTKENLTKQRKFQEGLINLYQKRRLTFFWTNLCEASWSPGLAQVLVDLKVKDSFFLKILLIWEDFFWIFQLGSIL